MESSHNDTIKQIDGNIEVEEEYKSNLREISYTVSCNELKTTKEVEDDLGKVWKFSHISGWGAEPEQDNFTVVVGAEDLSKDFTVDLADHMLKTLPWPKCYSVVRRGKPRYL